MGWYTVRYKVDATALAQVEADSDEEAAEAFEDGDYEFLYYIEEIEDGIISFEKDD